MLSALVNRLDAFLEAGASNGQTILHWTFPRCTVRDVKDTLITNGAESRYDLQESRINDVYVYESTRAAYIIFRGVAYSLTPALPTNVSDMSIWAIQLDEKNNPKTTNPLTIFNTSFQMTQISGCFPWQDPSDTSKTLTGYKIQNHHCGY
jgi:hypothetical protein